MIGIDVYSHKERHYRPLVDFESWRVAMLCFDDEFMPEQIGYMERHTQTDEVFVLLQGKCQLYFSESENDVLGEICSIDMEPGKIYNVKKGTWHTSALTKDAKVLIVENVNTDDDNTDYVVLSQKQKEQLVKQAVF